MIVKELVVQNNAGFHVRNASLLCKTAGKYNANLALSKGGGYDADCKSCLDLLTLMAPKDAVLTLKAEGEDAEQAVLEIEALFNQKFFEDEFEQKTENGVDK